CVGCLVGHLFMFLVGGKTPDQSVHLNLTTTMLDTRGGIRLDAPTLDDLLLRAMGRGRQAPQA
ncbi:hypothetical protein M2C01_15845, partial [Klebsiella pneumoniae]|nr:hypothetical protein [Klebsiella pneumoniae]MDZ0509574.1 hypothetical protein [Klebsiella pneumoniae]MDZ0531733.1 hypothetical protein [Klebsiella pneumoniae]MDZ0547959.1 hypothetical protein [Klebsiella pneumoniae]MDZ3042544.1 hypothetical protein [Klebsiella pneumoniae]